jgi:hypothetical protein
MTHQFFLIFVSFETSMTSHIVNFGSFFVQLQPNSIELNEDEEDEQTEGAMVKRLFFYLIYKWHGIRQSIGSSIRGQKTHNAGTM